MDVARNLLGICFALMLLVGVAEGSRSATSASGSDPLSKIDGSKLQTPLPTPRKRRPYNPETQPPETSSPNQAGAGSDQFSRCLPAEMSLDSLVNVTTSKGDPAPSAEKVTARMRLAQLKARCKRGKLVDAKGRHIYFYPLIGCWGNPPEDYLEQLQRQAAEIQRLKKRYTVIQIPCAQSVDPRTIS